MNLKILYGLPIGVNKIVDMSTLRNKISTQGAIFRVLIDHPNQVRILEEFERQQSTPRRWSAFVKVDGGQK
jgi:D-serine ammonia-lyase